MSIAEGILNIKKKIYCWNRDIIVCKINFTVVTRYIIFLNNLFFSISVILIKKQKSEVKLI